MATPSRLLPWSALKVLWSSRPQETGRKPRREARTGILEENYSPIVHGMVLSNPLVAEVAGYYGDSSFPRLQWQAVGGKLQAAQAAPQAPSARSARFSSGASEDEVRTWAKTL